MRWRPWRLIWEGRAMQIWVAEATSELDGFAAAKLDRDSPVGELYMLAVHPVTQHQGVGTALTETATDWLRVENPRSAGVERAPEHPRT
ncbi:MAG: GNAT family N-acetyltransferase [Acidimicrobiales bacterium]